MTSRSFYVQERYASDLDSDDDDDLNSDDSDDNSDVSMDDEDFDPYVSDEGEKDVEDEDEDDEDDDEEEGESTISITSSSTIEHHVIQPTSSIEPPVTKKEEKEALLPPVRAQALATHELPQQMQLKIVPTPHTGNIQLTPMKPYTKNKPVKTRPVKSARPSLAAAPGPSIIPQPVIKMEASVIMPMGTSTQIQEAHQLIVRDPSETERDYEFRKNFALKVKQNPQLKMTDGMIDSYSKIMVQSVKYGVKYDESVEKVLDYIKGL